MAISAATSKNQPTEYGNIVVQGDRVLATGAGRARLRHRQTQGQTVDTHIQKAAEGQPEDKNRRCENGIQFVFCALLKALADSRPALENAAISLSCLDYKAIICCGAKVLKSLSKRPVGLQTIEGQQLVASDLLPFHETFQGTMKRKSSPCNTVAEDS